MARNLENLGPPKSEDYLGYPKTGPRTYFWPSPWICAKFLKLHESLSRHRDSSVMFFHVFCRDGFSHCQFSAYRVERIDTPDPPLVTHPLSRRGTMAAVKNMTNAQK